MRNILTALIVAGSIATATLVTASSADAQWIGSGWRVGGDYYNPSAYSYGSAPLYSYGSAPSYGTGVGVEPMQTIQTIETVRTVRPAARSTVRRQIVTTRTTIRTFAANTYSQPLYDYAGTTPIVSAPAYRSAGYYDYGTSYARPLYNTVATPVTQTVAAPLITAPAYRYVYQWDRILVVDPSTNVIVQALPR
jgi:hypothetical protein